MVVETIFSVQLSPKLNNILDKKSFGSIGILGQKTIFRSKNTFDKNCFLVQKIV